jgi:hypothetical protein
MAALLQKLEEDIRKALRSKEELRLQTLRLLKSDLQYEMTKTGAKDLSDEEVQAIIKRAIKKRGESEEQYRKADRAELAQKEADEIQILDAYLPAEIGEAAIRAVLDAIIQDSNPTAKDMGRVVGRVMAHFKGQNIDGALVKEIVQKKLQA